jgi:predicted transcriptional regulator
LVLSPDIEVDFTAVECLSRSDLLLVNTVLQHGTLSAQECAQIFREEINTTRMKMQKLQQVGLLISVNDRFHIQPFLIPALTNTLQQNKLGN